MQDDKDINIPVREGSRSGSGSSADLKAKLLSAQGSSDRYAQAAVPARSLKHRCLIVLALVPCLPTGRSCSGFLKLQDVISTVHIAPSSACVKLVVLLSVD